MTGVRCEGRATTYLHCDAQQGVEDACGRAVGEDELTRVALCNTIKTWLKITDRRRTSKYNTVLPVKRRSPPNTAPKCTPTIITVMSGEIWQPQ
jgi:hypothetical protein